MASSNEKHNHQNPPQQQGTPPPSQPDHSGLQVVESGLEVAGSDQSEALSAGSYPSSHPFIHNNNSSSQASPPLRYAEQKGYDWNGAPPPQVVPIEQTGIMIGPGGYLGRNRLYSASTGTSQQQHQYLGGHNPFDPAAGKPGKKPICGLKRNLFWGIVGVAVIVMVLAVAVGLGVGLAVRNSSIRHVSFSLVSFLPWYPGTSIITHRAVLPGPLVSSVSMKSARLVHARPRFQRHALLCNERVSAYIGC